MHPSLLKSLNHQIKKVQTTPKWFKTSFKQQTDFINDPAKFKAAYCTRRAGKSYGTGIYMCKEAYENPGVSILYIALTRRSAMRIMWKDVLQPINRALGLNIKFDEPNQLLRFPNGSIIYIEGADASQDAMNKFLGQKFKLAILDEAAKFKNNIETLIFDILSPALADLHGTLAMIGTTNDFIESYFAKVTRKQIEGWSVHRWSAIDNPHMKSQFQDEMTRLKAMNPNVEIEPWFRQNYLAEWVVDERKRLFKYSTEILCTNLPDLHFTYNLGITFPDNTTKAAFSIVAYSPQSRTAYVVESFESDITNFYGLSALIEDLQKRYDFVTAFCAGVSKRFKEEIELRFDISITDLGSITSDFQALQSMFATDLASNHIHVLESQNKDLTTQWDSIIIDSTNGKIHSLCKTNVAYAAICAWTECYNYNYSAPHRSDDPMDEYWQSLIEEYEYKEITDD